MPKKSHRRKSVRRRKTVRRRRVRGGADSFPMLPSDQAIRVSNPASSDDLLAYSPSK